MRWFRCVVVALLFVPSASAAPIIENAWINIFEPVDAASFEFDLAGCEYSEFTLLDGGAGFLFQEAGPAESPADENLQPGYYNAGCGVARYAYTAPVPEYDHAHARFVADRSINQFIGFTPIQVEQSVFMTGMDDARQIFELEAGSRQPTYIFDSRTSSNASQGVLEFRFRDQTFFNDAGAAGEPLSGVHVAGTVRDVELEYSYVPADVVSVETKRRTSESVAVEETVVKIRVPNNLLQDYSVDLQVQTDVNHTFYAAIAPDGTLLEATGTRTGPGPRGYDHTRVLTEDLGNPDVHQVTVPHEIVTGHGAGIYTLVFHERNALEPSSVLMPLAIFALVLPGGAAGIAGYGLRQFHRTEAPSFAFAGRSLLRGFIFLLGVYTVALVAILWGPGAKGLATPPATVVVVMSYVLLTILTALFLYIWYLGSRVLLRAAKRSEQVARKQALELARSNKDLEEFAHIASHDLKEPLRTIRNYTSLLQRRYAGKLDEQADEFISYAADGAERMGGLIDGLLEYSRVDSSGGDQGLVSMHAVARQVRQDLKRQIDEAGARISQNKLPDVVGSRAQLHQVMLNLLSNAIKFRDHGRPLHIAIRAVREGALWRFEVEDNGIGIPAPSADRIFEMFYHADPTKERGGTGVGLAVVRRVVERHGGSCGVASDPGNGCRVWFTLPALAEGMQ